MFQSPSLKIRRRKGSRNPALDPSYAEIGAVAGMLFGIGSRIEVTRVPAWREGKGCAMFDTLARMQSGFSRHLGGQRLPLWRCFEDV